MYGYRCCVYDQYNGSSRIDIDLLIGRVHRNGER